MSVSGERREGILSLHHTVNDRPIEGATMLDELRPAYAFSGTLISAAELVDLADFAAPSHFVTPRHQQEAATALAEWCDFEHVPALRALQLARSTNRRPEVIELLSLVDAMLDIEGHHHPDPELARTA
ncbi:MAG TPA: hypothetical protein VFZ17_10470 [Acidimicrobiia bacterium]|nr:hypothetical protein [Acidimicrobiia bacterium]